MTSFDDAPRRAQGRRAEDFSDALTFAFSDPAADVCGVARLGLSASGASGLVMLFGGGRPLVVHADADGDTGARWEDVRAAGLTTETAEPGRRWRLRLEGETPLELDFEAAGQPFALAADSDVGRVGGMEGFDHVCRVTGTVAGEAFAGRGQRSRSWGTPDWERMALARTITVWFEDDRAVSALTARPAKARDHAAETRAVVVLEEGVASEVADARISTTYDAAGRQRAAGLELHVGADDEYAQRIAGEAAAGTTLELGRLTLHCAFFRWRSGDREGAGRYDVLRRT